MESNVDINGLKFFKKILRFRPKKERTYILPTKFGAAFAATFFIIFFFAIGYSNNLIYLFVFLSSSIGIVGMWLTNKNIESLYVSGKESPVVYADNEAAALEFYLNTSRKEGSWQLQCQQKGEKSLGATLDIPEPGCAEKFYIDKKFSRRGLQNAPLITVQSDFPLGMFLSWRTIRPWDEILVYPKLDGTRTLPVDSSAGPDGGGLGVFREHRTYTASDSMNRIDWKASARRSEILTKYYENTVQKSFSFRWQQTSHIPNFEGRVSQLALWVDQTYRENNKFTLQLGSRLFDLPEPEQNWRQAMGALATLQEKDC